MRLAARVAVFELAANVVIRKLYDEGNPVVVRLN
jgi:hypothetical protein